MQNIQNILNQKTDSSISPKSKRKLSMRRHPSQLHVTRMILCKHHDRGIAKNRRSESRLIIAILFFITSMLESKETTPHITTKEELDALYKNVLQNKESIGEDPDKIAQKILSIYDTTAAMENKVYNFKKNDEKGKREYAVSLGQQQETYKTIEIVYNKTTGYVITIQQNG